MLLAVRISSYGCTWEVWRALKKLMMLSTIDSCFPDFPCASIIRYTHGKHELILYFYNNACINVKPEGGEPRADVGDLTFQKNFW